MGVTCTYDLYTKQNDENDNRFCSNIINIHINPPLSNHGRHLYECVTCTYDLYTKHNDENDNRFCSKTSSISIVTHHCQITVVTCMNVSHARMTYIPSTMMTH